MFEDVLRIAIKVAIASLVVGAVLTHFGITIEVLIKQAGLTPERIQELLQQGVTWALPNMLLGSLVIVPAWLLAILLRPPRRSSLSSTYKRGAIILSSSALRGLPIHAAMINAAATTAIMTVHTALISGFTPSRTSE